MNGRTKSLAARTTRELIEKAQSKRFSMKKWVIGHLRRFAVLAVSAPINNPVVFWLIGLLNKRYRFLTTVFVAYGASRDYNRAYFYNWHERILRWRLWPVGIFRQNGRWGLMTGISSVEEDFYRTLTDERERENLTKLLHRTERVQKLLHADQITFAGVLPGIMAKAAIRTESPETDVTVEAVIKAEANIRQLLNYPSDAPIIVLGGKGHVGERLVRRFDGREIYSVDLLHGKKINYEEWPRHLADRREKCILINLTKMTVVEDYVFLFWPQLAILNEAYPPPSARELEFLQGVGVRVFHVVGVEAFSMPPFPKAYRGGIPCCAAWNSPDMRVNVRELTGGGAD